MKIQRDTVEFLSKLGYEFPDEPRIPENIFDRLDHIHEELIETRNAAATGDLDEVIDGLIDLIYIAAGTIPMCGTDIEPHWDEVQAKNMMKERGITKRGHSFDAVKPADWTPPDHITILRRKGYKG